MVLAWEGGRSHPALALVRLSPALSFAETAPSPERSLQGRCRWGPSPCVLVLRVTVLVCERWFFTLGRLRLPCTPPLAVHPAQWRASGWGAALCCAPRPSPSCTLLLA